MVKLTDAEIRSVSQRRRKDKEYEENLCSGRDSKGRELDEKEVLRKLKARFASKGLFSNSYKRMEELEYKYSSRK